MLSLLTNIVSSFRRSLESGTLSFLKACFVPVIASFVGHLPSELIPKEGKDPASETGRTSSEVREGE